MGWFWDKQPSSVRLGSRAHRRNGVLYQGGDERKRMKGSLSNLANDKKNDNARTAYARARAQAHPPNKFVWKVTEVSHCHYAARCCHFIVSHQSITQTNVCLRARTRAAETHAPFYPADKSTKKKKKSFQHTAESYKTSGVSTKQTAFLVVMKLQQPALMNTNTGMLDPKINAHMGVILASKPVRSVLSREPHAPLLLHYGVFLM